ncbi:MAG: acetylxylan esterase [Lentisphaerae bacterium]|nr:acetylxylan esterase [Lentisphaerota bacterium]
MRRDYSPGAHHAYLARHMPQALAYDGGDVRAWQRRLRRKLKQLLGDMPDERVPLQAERLWRREHELGTIEKVVFRSEPHADVPAFVCLPRNVEPPYPFTICVQGHSTGMHNSIAVEREDNTKPFKVEGDRDFGLWCMTYGVAALCIEQRAFGERRKPELEYDTEHPCHEASMHALMLGRTLIGERVFDIDRAIDYLATRGDADMKRIGVMGHSGGGTASVFGAAILPRIAFAMPSGYFCTFRDSILSMHHCMCNYIPGMLQVAEMADIMGLFAPRPLVIVAGAEDPIFPVRATKRAFRRLKQIYAAAGAAARCHLVIGKGGHRFYAEDAWPVMKREISRLQPLGAARAH